jgi:hypothetical protein
VSIANPLDFRPPPFGDLRSTHGAEPHAAARLDPRPRRAAIAAQYQR